MFWGVWLSFRFSAWSHLGLIALSISTSTTSSSAAPAISSENHIHENSSKLPMVYVSLHVTFITSIQSHLLLFDYNFFFSFEKCIFSVTKLRHIVSSFHTLHICYSRFYFLVTLVYVFCVLHAYSCPVLSSYLLWFASLPPLQRFEIVRRLPTNKSFR